MNQISLKSLFLLVPVLIHGCQTNTAPKSELQSPLITEAQHEHVVQRQIEKPDYVHFENVPRRQEGQFDDQLGIRILPTEPHRSY